MTNAFLSKPDPLSILPQHLIRGMIDAGVYMKRDLGWRNSVKELHAETKKQDKTKKQNKKKNISHLLVWLLAAFKDSFFLTATQYD